MIIIGENLKKLNEQHKISDSLDSFDNTSLSLRLDEEIIKIKKTDKPIVYGENTPKQIIESIKIKDYLKLNPKECCLACSLEKISIPLGYFGLIQTKGSLARLFVSVHCSDGQIEPGFSGKITFEICNFSDNTILIPLKSCVSDLFIFKASSKNTIPYQGKYNNSTIPTISKQ